MLQGQKSLQKLKSLQTLHAMEAEGQRSIVDDAEVACTALEYIRDACSSDTRPKKCQSELVMLRVARAIEARGATIKRKA